MSVRSIDRFLKAVSGCLALLFIVIAVPAGHGDCFTSPALGTAQPSRLNAGVDLVWVRQDPPVINVNNDPTYYDSVEPRFAGTYTQYTVTDTEIAMDTRYVDHGYEWYKVKMKTVFDRPPIVLNPALRYKVTAAASHSGTWNTGSVGMQFWYSSPNSAVIEPKEVLGYYPFDSWWTGLSSKEWMINTPAALQEGATFKITAAWWNCPPCNVTWTYRAEPANAVPRLGVEVVQPIVIYQGQEVAPGETFFPETCPATTTQTLGSCSYEQQMEERAKAYYKCISDNEERILTIISLFEFTKDEDIDLDIKKILMKIIEDALAPRCGYKESAVGAGRLNQADAYRLDLALDEGAMHLINVAGGQTTSVKTPLGTAVAAAQGAFLAAYKPATNVATFRAYSTPLTLQPKSGSDLILQPYHEVKLTPSGFGPVTELPHLYLYLPMLSR